MMIIANMTDEELVKAVSEEVMGWELRTACTYRIQGTDELLYYPGTNCVIDAYTFDPLHRADHWWMVVLRMRELGLFFTMHNDRSEGGYYAEFYAINNIRCRSMDKPIGQAICEAALAAVRGKEGE